MNGEQFPSEPNEEVGEKDVEERERRLGIQNLMEIKLCARRCGFNFTEEEREQWNQEFREKLSDLLEGRPDLYEREIDDAVGEIADLLYEDKKVAE